MSVHVPLSCIALTPFADLVALYLHRAELWGLSALLATGGVAFGLIAAMFGALDFERAHQKAPKTVLWHAIAMVSAVSLEAVSLAGRFSEEMAIVLPAPTWSTLVSAAALAALLVGAYLGGHLVYHHGVNVRERKS